MNFNFKTTTIIVQLLKAGHLGLRLENKNTKLTKIERKIKGVTSSHSTKN
jgi:hypothetical protein